MKYRFEILYQSRSGKYVSDFMNKCDVIVGDICVSDIVTFTSENRIDIGLIKKTLTQAYESTECKVFKIEGGTIE